MEFNRRYTCLDFHFSLTLVKVIRDYDINTGGSIFSRFIQILAYAKNVDIISRCTTVLGRHFFEAGEISVEKEVKSKYTYAVVKKESQPLMFKFGSFKLETVKNFTFVFSDINCQNLNLEIRKRITAANYCFFGLRSLLKSHLIKRTNIFLKKALMKLALTSETWTFNDEEGEGRGSL